MIKKQYSIGVDVGGTKTIIHIADASGRVAHSLKYPSSREVSDLVENTQRILTEAGVDAKDIAYMAVGVPGRVDRERGIVLDAPGLMWENLSLKKLLSRAVPFPVYIDNDVRMALIGEKYCGAVDNIEDMIFIAIGTGLGSAVLSGGYVLEGAQGSAGEIGYLIGEEEAKNGLINETSAFGTMERKVSGSALKEKAESAGITFGDLFPSYGKDPRAKAIVDEFLLSLSCVIANLASVLNPEIVVLGGGISNELPTFLDGIGRTVARLTPVRCAVRISSLGENAGAVGACAYGRYVDERRFVLPRGSCAASRRQLQ